jgi:general secretion pathway protein G
MKCVTTAESCGWSREVDGKRARAAGLMSAAHRTPVAGFTLIEILVAIAIILTIAALAIPNFLQAVERAKIARAVGDIRTISNEVVSYQIINQKFPASLTDTGYGANLDPWGNPYRYLNFENVKGKGKMRKDRFLVPLNSYFDLYSMGKDGQTLAPLTAGVSKDDVIFANDGAFIGLASDY